MISSKTVIDKANTKITAGLTETEVIQLSVIDDSITKSKLVVATVGDLPSALNNEGRLVYVTETELYYFSNGEEWLSDYSTVILLVSSAYSLGFGLEGELGDGTTISRSSPVTVVGGITNWSQVSAGDDYSIGITDDGVAYAWGKNSNGQIGDGTTVAKSSPVTVIGGITNWSSVSAGYTHILGVTDTGIAYAWGFGGNGRLGDGTTIGKSSPVTVIGGITNWSSVSAGPSHSLGLTDTGIAYAWGRNISGQAGDGTLVDRSSPVTIVGGITNWSQVSAGNSHSLGLTDTGVVYAWGYNSSGQLGEGSTIFKTSPVTVVGGITNWSSIGAGGGHSLGVTDTGIAYAWGSGSNGRLGDGTTIGKSSPVTVVGGITNWSQVSATQTRSFGIANGIVYAWGSNGFGGLGDGTTITRSSPVTVIGGITNWSQVSAGLAHSLALSATTKGFNEP